MSGVIDHRDLDLIDYGLSCGLVIGFVKVVEHHKGAGGSGGLLRCRGSSGECHEHVGGVGRGGAHRCLRGLSLGSLLRLGGLLGIAGHLLQSDLVDVLGVDGVAAHVGVGFEHGVDICPSLFLAHGIPCARDDGHALAAGNVGAFGAGLCTRLGALVGLIQVFRMRVDDMGIEGMDADAYKRARGKRQGCRGHHGVGVVKRYGRRKDGGGDGQAGAHRKTGDKCAMLVTIGSHVQTPSISIYLSHGESAHASKPRLRACGNG